MRGLLVAGLLSLLLLFPGAEDAKANCTAPCTKTQVTTDINTNWPDNTSQLITPALLRSTVLDLVNSYLDVNGASTFTCPTHQWLEAIATLSSYTCTQPAAIDLSAGLFNVALGYVTGAGVGGAVTQLTNRTTAVTLNNLTGAITLVTTTAVVGTWISFTVNNSTVAATDIPKVAVKSATNTYVAIVSSVAAGSFQITFQSVAGTASDTPVINFLVLKGSNN